MLPADWLEYVRDAERNIKRPPNPPKRLQPKVTRHQSSRMRIVSGQQIDPIKAAYQPENQFNRTPLAPSDFVGTREVGPGDVNNSNTNWRTGNMTVEASINGNKQKPRSNARPSRAAQQGARTDITALAAKFII
jgi:hypothetical protein